MCVCVCVCVCVRLVGQSCLNLCDPKDCSPAGSSVHGISQTGILEWVAISSSRGSSRPRDRTCVSCISFTGGWAVHRGATWEAMEAVAPEGAAVLGPLDWFVALLILQLPVILCSALWGFSLRLRGLSF